MMKICKCWGPLFVILLCTLVYRFISDWTYWSIILVTALFATFVSKQFTNIRSTIYAKSFLYPPDVSHARENITKRTEQDTEISFIRLGTLGYTNVYRPVYYWTRTWMEDVFGCWERGERWNESRDLLRRVVLSNYDCVRSVIFAHWLKVWRNPNVIIIFFF